MKLCFYPFTVNNIMVFCSVTPCGLIDELKHFWEQCLHFERRRRNINTAGVFFFSKTSVPLYETARQCISEESQTHTFYFFKEGNFWESEQGRQDRSDVMSLQPSVSTIFLFCPWHRHVLGYVPKVPEICCNCEVLGISQYVVPICQMTRHSIPEGCNLQNS